MKIDNNKGITLVALVITIIVLLILAGVSLSAVFSEKGIFSRAENAVDRYSQSKAREMLDLTLSEAQMKKYDEGLSEDALDKIIEEVGELIPKDDPESKNQLVIVEGYIFEIDKSVPRVVEDKGRADDIIITARLSNNETNGWIKPSESEAIITGTIKTYSGGEITKVSATKDGVSISGFTIDENGRYEIRVMESATFKITAEDSKNKKKEKEIKAEVKVDNKKPTVDSVTATPEGNKIKLSATGTDNESGIDYFSYTITPENGVTPSKGTFKKNETAEINVTSWIVYTIKVTATDKCENVSETALETQADMTDTTGPTITSSNVTADRLNIKIEATATDDKSGVKEFSYTITPTTGLSKSTGTFAPGKTETITSTQEQTYTVTITAIDNNNNKSTSEKAEVTTIDGITLAEAKSKISASNLKSYIGTRVIDYTPDDSGVAWRVFYYDADNYFGDGKGTLYLKRDYDSNSTAIFKSIYQTYTPSDGGAMMKQINPLWGKSSYTTIDNYNERCVAWLCDTTQWAKYCDTKVAKYAIGGPSAEMYVKAFNAYKGKTNALVCKVGNQYGYSFGKDGNYTWNNSSGHHSGEGSIEAGPHNVFMTSGSNWWLASTSGQGYNNTTCVAGKTTQLAWADYVTTNGVCPIVSIKH